MTPFTPFSTYLVTMVQSLPALLFLLYYFYLVDLPYPYSLVKIGFDFLHVPHTL